MQSGQASGLGRPTSHVFGKTVWGKVAEALAVVGIVLVLTVFFTDGTTREALYTVGFLVLLMAVVAAVLDRIRSRGERLLFLPSTVLGWWAAALLLVGLALGVAGWTQVSGGAENSLEAVTNVVALAVAVLAIVAVLKKGERSVPVIVLSVLPGMFVLYFALGELALPH